MNRDDKTSVIAAGCLVGLIVLLVLSAFGFQYACRNVIMSEGFRDSTFRKMSDSGVIWVTTEAEFLGDGLFRGDTGGIKPETFTYTVRDEKVKRALASTPPNSKCRVYYTKYLTRWLPNGESSYVITRIEALP